MDGWNSITFQSNSFKGVSTLIFIRFISLRHMKNVYTYKIAKVCVGCKSTFIYVKVLYFVCVHSHFSFRPLRPFDR
jgi:hypothetical protein